MFRPVALFLALALGSSAQMLNPYLMYGGGLGMYGGMNPYLYSGALNNYADYNSLLLNPYAMDVQSTMLANYNAMNGLNAVTGYGALNPALTAGALNPALATGALNPALATNFGSTNVLDSGNTLNENTIRGLRNRLPVMSRDGGLTRLSGHSLFDCTGILSSRPCAGPKRNIGAGTNWENTRDRR